MFAVFLTSFESLAASSNQVAKALDDVRVSTSKSLRPNSFFRRRRFCSGSSPTFAAFSEINSSDKLNGLISGSTTKR